MVEDTAGAPGAIKVLLDTNVVLDLLLGRQPWLSEAQPVWDAYNAGAVRICVSATTITNVFYVCRRLVGLERARQAVTRCAQGFEMLPVTGAVIVRALSLASPDFEDDLQIASAQAGGMSAIITRDLTGFAHSPLAALSPQEAAARYRLSSA